MQATHKPITRKSSPTCAYHRFLQFLMPTYINAMPIAMNIIDNTANIPTPPFPSFHQHVSKYTLLLYGNVEHHSKPH